MIPVLPPQLCCSEAGWSNLLMSQRFSRTSLPQDGMAHSTFTCHQATIVCSLYRCLVNNFIYCLTILFIILSVWVFCLLVLSGYLACLVHRVQKRVLGSRQLCTVTGASAIFIWTNHLSGLIIMYLAGLGVSWGVCPVCWLNEDLVYTPGQMVQT